jgi:NAD(P)H dehydrogenase (quinone)
MAKVAIVYHSGFGHTAVQAESVATGARSVAGTEVTVVKVEEWEAHADALNAADAIIFGSPTYMGSASAQFKTFMDATGKIWYGQGWKDKLAAGFTNSASQSGDKLNTLVQLAVFAAQHSMIWVSLGELPQNNSSTSSPDTVNRLGTFLGATAQSNNDQGPDLAPPPADRKTAEILGARVAHHAARWAKGA